MKILPIITNINKKIKTRTLDISRAGTNGYKIAQRTSDIYNQNIGCKYYNITKSIGRQLYRESTIDDLPIIAGALGMFVPFVGVSPAMFLLGKVVQFAVNLSRGKIGITKGEEIKG